MGEPTPEPKSAAELFVALGLPLPFLPPDLARLLQPRRPFELATLPIEASSYDLDHFAVLAGQAGPELLVLGHAGHGVSSYAVSYFVIRARYAVLVQLGWGGVYMKAELRRPKVSEALDLASRLVQHLEQDPPADRPVLVLSDLRVWGSLQFASGQRSTQWREDARTLLADAFRLLR